MQRISIYLFSPEILLGLLNLGVILFCARHRTYSDSDVQALSCLAFLLPALAVLAGFALIFVPTPKTWGWLARANLETWATLLFCGFQIVSGFGAPGSGPKGQDAGFILILSFGLCATALANAFSLSQIFRGSRTSWDTWLSSHPVAGFLAVGAGAVPVMFAQLLLFGVLVGVGSFVLTLVRR